jgi:DNA polymerase-3 subunit delta'
MQQVTSSMAPDQAALPPWLQPIWQRLLAGHGQRRLGQALMITGPSGVGKELLVERLVGLLLCHQPGAEGQACGSCADCRLLQVGNHPDAIRIAPDGEGARGEIRAEQVRALCSRENLTPTRGAHKVLVLRPAEAMNAFAANSLLKTLEEPVPSSTWVLVAARPHQLPATIRSRCQRVDLPPPSEAVALPWLRARLARPGSTQTGDHAELLLRLAHGAPLRALSLSTDDALTARQALLDALAAIVRGERDPIAVANDWQGFEVAEVVALMIDLVGDLLRLAAAPQAARLTNLDRQPLLESMVARLDTKTGHRFLQNLLQLSGLLDAPLNKQLLFESLLVRWASIIAAGRTDRGPVSRSR